MGIDIAKIHTKWQKKREETHIYTTKQGGNKPKQYILDMFPYASGAGLHVGHPKGYIATDVISRKKRLSGYNVLHPMGFDSFGLPTEQFAIKNKRNPKEVTAECIAHFKSQLHSIGFDYDRDRCVSTTDVDFYTWSQRIFLQLYDHYYDEEKQQAQPIAELEKKIEQKKIILPDTVSVSDFISSKRLAYVDRQPVNWCPGCKTGLANEDLEGGACERCGSVVEKKLMKQWMLKITTYAQRLLDGLDELSDWPHSVKEMQRNWIGKKEGINIHYPIIGTQEEIVCFTTRPDTNFGATFVVLAPEHGLVEKILRKEIPVDDATYAAIQTYVDTAKKTSAMEREAAGRKKTGVFTGLYADHRLMHNTQIPIWISDFVLGGFGTGAVVGVPGHDMRDFEFATTFDLPIIRVVVGPDGDTSPITQASQVQEESGTMVHSDFLNGLDIHAATHKIMEYYEKKGRGTITVNYRLQERVFSRQRYRGEPIPMAWAKDEHAMIPFIEIHRSQGKYICTNPDIEALRHAVCETTPDGFVEIVCGISTNADGAYLMMHQTHVNSFVFPGGKVNKGETLEDAVIREFGEELGVQITVGTYYGAVKKQIDGYKIRLHYFAVHVQGNPHIKEKKHSDLHYVQIESSDNACGFACNIQNTITDSVRDIQTACIDMYLFQYVLQQHETNKQYLSDAACVYPTVCDPDTYYVQYFDTQSRTYYMVSDKEYQTVCDNSQYTILVPLTDKDLPLELPDVESYEPTGTGESPLAAIGERMYGTLPDGRQYRRESNTMPQRAGSSWYWLRYMDPRNTKALVDPEIEKYRGQVDTYVGGMEHATRHLIYARFWHKFLYDIGVVSTSEPFKKLRSQGLIMAEDGRKMSKRRGNVINPDDVIAEFGADTFRAYEMFMGPFENAVARSTAGVKGIKTFLDKVVKVFARISDETQEPADKVKKLDILLHKTIEKVGNDIDDFKFNTAISQMMIFINEAVTHTTIRKDMFEKFVIIIAPFAPHLAEEMWEQMGNTYSVFTTGQRPKVDQSLLIEDTIQMAVQINGKVRDTIIIMKDADEETAVSLAKQSANVQKYIDAGTVRKVVYVPGKILNIVVG